MRQNNKSNSIRLSPQNSHLGWINLAAATAGILMTILHSTPAMPAPPTTAGAIPVSDAAGSPTREHMESFLTTMLSEHLLGIEGGLKRENEVSATVEHCSATFQTRTGDDREAPGYSHTEASSSLKDVVDITATKSVRIRITGSSRSTKVIYTANSQSREQTGSLTIVLDSADAARRIEVAMDEVVSLCGGLHSEVAK